MRTVSLAPIRVSFQRLLAARDYELKDRLAPLRGYDTFLGMARDAGFRPGTVIDVGVAFGTPWLHDAFPDAHLVLIEPQSQFAGVIDGILSQRAGEWHRVALGDGPGTATLHVMTSEPGSSSLHAMSDEQAASYDARGIERGTHDEEVSVVRFDSLDTSHWPRPWLLKIDAEGHELGILHGVGALLSNVDMIIAEVALNNAYGGATFAETLLAFEQAGFPLYDIVAMQARGRTGRVVMVDGVFLPAGRSVLEPGSPSPVTSAG